MQLGRNEFPNRSVQSLDQLGHWAVGGGVRGEG